MAKRNELAVWREKMASGGYASALEAGIALDRITKRRMFALAEAYEDLRVHASARFDEYSQGACDAQAAILRGLAGAGY